ncbi:MAG: four helix bundle protein [bacterium]|nr:four helix bundle protein [bacterium]
MGSKSFKELVVWNKSIILAKEVYNLTKKLPKEEIYGLVSQMRRCAVSIPSNIAEGSKRRTRKDFVQFLRIASGSAAELETQIVIVKDLYPEIISSYTETLLVEIQKMLTSLIRKLEESG